MRRHKVQITESELAALLVDVLKDWGWEVYQEVSGGCGVCDLVAKRGQIIWAIEAKLAFGLPVLEQAHRWRFSAHYVSILLPLPYLSSFGNKICADYGIGTRNEN